MDNLAQTEELFLSAEEAESEEVIRRRLRDAAAPIVSRLSKLAQDATSKRKEIETRWLEDMCQYAGVRNVQETRNPEASKSDTGKSQVFVNITRSKTNRTEGRICDILFPADDKNWGISPTPMPDLSVVARKGMEEAKRAAEEANRIEEQGNPSAVSPDGMGVPELIEQAADLGEEAISAQDKIDEAKRRAEAMTMLIDDQLVEARYAMKSRDAIGWACKIGVGILKGPVLIDKAKMRWHKGEEGYELSGPQADTNTPSVECVSPWAFFPDPSATTIEDAEYVLERHIPSKRDMRKMARQLGFDKEVVAELLEEGPGHGQADDLAFLSDIRLLTGETTAIQDRFVLWEYHGQLTVDEVATLIRSRGTPEAEDQAAMFEEDADPLDERNVIAWFCNGRLLKISEYYPMDSGALLYSVFSFERGNASILGAIGVPRMMRDAQMVLNAAWRMMVDNAALSVAPQVLMNQAAVKPHDGDWTMKPRKVWLWDSNNSVQKPFEIFNVPVNQEQIAGIIALAEAFIDEETSMPRVAEGGGSMEQAAGVTSTVGGFAMLLNAAGVNIRRIVKNWDDDVTSGLIRRIYDWNMQYSPREEVKGDMEIEARGTSVLLVREMQAQNLSVLASQWTVHPVLASVVKPYEMARMTLQALSINPADVLVNQEEYDQVMSSATTEQQEPEDPQWQIRLQIAEMDRATRIEVAQMDHEAEMMKLSASQSIELEKIAAQLEAIREKNATEERKTAAKAQSDERKLAVEVAVEEQAARDAAVSGRVPTGSGGAISLGSENP